MEKMKEVAEKKAKEERARLEAEVVISLQMLLLLPTFFCCLKPFKKLLPSDVILFCLVTYLMNRYIVAPPGCITSRPSLSH